LFPCFFFCVLEVLEKPKKTKGPPFRKPWYARAARVHALLNHPHRPPLPNPGSRCPSARPSSLQLILVEVL
jgi:hypothetical protein